MSDCDCGRHHQDHHHEDPLDEPATTAELLLATVEQILEAVLETKEITMATQADQDAVNALFADLEKHVTDAVDRVTAAVGDNVALDLSGAKALSDKLDAIDPPKPADPITPTPSPAAPADPSAPPVPTDPSAPPVVDPTVPAAHEKSLYTTTDPANVSPEYVASGTTTDGQPTYTFAGDLNAGDATGASGPWHLYTPPTADPNAPIN